VIPLASQGVQAWDRYAGMNNNPVRYNDPSGKCIDPDSCPNIYLEDNSPSTSTGTSTPTPPLLTPTPTSHQTGNSSTAIPTPSLSATPTPTLPTPTRNPTSTPYALMAQLPEIEVNVVKELIAPPIDYPQSYPLGDLWDTIERTPPFEIKTPTIVIQPGIKPDVNGQKPIPMGPPIVIPSHTYYFNTKSIAQNGRFVAWTFFTMVKIAKSHLQGSSPYSDSTPTPSLPKW